MPHQDYIGPDGKPWPSVTEVGDVLSKPSLYRFYADNGWDGAIKIASEAASIGTEFHNEIYHRLSGLVNPNPPKQQAKEMVDVFFKEFVTPYKVEPVILEQHVINNEKRYHGSFDGIIKVTNMPIEVRYGKPSQELYSGLVLADWKSSNGIYDSHAIQLGGYYKAVPGYSDVGLIVQVKKDTLKLKYKFYKGLDHYGNIFYNLREVYDYVKSQGAWAKE